MKEKNETLELFQLNALRLGAVYIFDLSRTLSAWGLIWQMHSANQIWTWLLSEEERKREKEIAKEVFVIASLLSVARLSV